MTQSNLMTRRDGSHEPTTADVTFERPITSSARAMTGCRFSRPSSRALGVLAQRADPQAWRHIHTACSPCETTGRDLPQRTRVWCLLALRFAIAATSRHVRLVPIAASAKLGGFVSARLSFRAPQ